MRIAVVLGYLILLTACSGDPRSLGITGPGVQPAPAVVPLDAPDSDTAPGVSTSGPLYGPTNRPTSGSSGFFGYN
jgi:hypothetical protein